MIKKIILILTVIMTFSHYSHASIVISGTRLIYPGKEKEVSITLSNSGSTPVLMQAWLDNGNESSHPQDIDSLFFMTPPLARIDEGKSLSLRVFKTDAVADLPNDRESLFYLNILDIPPEQNVKKTDGAEVQFTVRSRIKFFYRPDGLSGSANSAPDNLIFRKNKNEIIIENPSPYYINLSSVSVVNDKKSINLLSYEIIEPFSSIKIKKKEGHFDYVYYESINDLGGIFKFKKNIK